MSNYQNINRKYTWRHGHTNDQHIPDLEQVNKTCGRVKLVLLVHNPPLCMVRGEHENNRNVCTVKIILKSFQPIKVIPHINDMKNTKRGTPKMDARSC